MSDHIIRAITADGSVKAVAITGRDLIAAGMEPGPRMGQVLQQLLQMVLEHPEWNTREILLKRFQELES